MSASEIHQETVTEVNSESQSDTKTFMTSYSGWCLVWKRKSCQTKGLKSRLTDRNLIRYICILFSREKLD
jgi:hypothetical protein